MAARILLQRRALAPLAGTALVGATLYPRSVFAEALDEKPQSKKPIYDDFETLPPPNSSTPPPTHPSSSTPLTPSAPEPTTPPDRPRRPTPTDRLAAQIRQGRLFLYRRAAAAEDAVNAGMDRAFALEQSFTRTVAGLAPPRESGERLMPGLIYVLVAAMAGSIVARRRNVLLRAAVPVGLGLVAGSVVLPITMRNCGELAWRYEQRVPALANAHLQVREGVDKSVSFAKVHARLGQQLANDKVTAVRETLEGWVKKGK